LRLGRPRHFREIPRVARRAASAGRGSAIPWSAIWPRVISRPAANAAAIEEDPPVWPHAAQTPPSGQFDRPNRMKRGEHLLIEI